MLDTTMHENNSKTDNTTSPDNIIVVIIQPILHM